MKKIYILAMALLALLTSCSKTETLDYCNTPDGCILGCTQYCNQDAMGIQQWNPAWEEPYMGLCRDPLCTHDAKDSLCPSSVYMQFGFQMAATDGNRLYINTGNDLAYKNGEMFRQIYSLNPDGSEFTLLHTFPATGNTPPSLQYADGYLYFKQGVYNENYDSGNGSFDDQIMKTMRIPVSGGEAETVLDGINETETEFYVDDENYYLISFDENNSPAIDVIDKKNGTVMENVLPGIGMGSLGVTVYAGQTWLTHTFFSEDTDRFDPMGDLYVWKDGRFEPVCDDKFDYSFGGGIWYKERSGRTLIGTVDAPTGGPGGEAQPVELFIEPTAMLCRLDPADFSITEFVPSDDFDSDDTIHIDCTSESGIRAHVSNNRKRLAQENSEYDCLIRCENGTITIEKVYD